MARSVRGRAEERWAYWSMVSPAFLLYLLVLGFPIVISVVLSLSNYGGGKMFGGEPWRITGLEQYAKLVRDPYFWLALKNNLYIVLVSVFGQLPLGFAFAYLIYRKVVKFGEFWQGVLYMPSIISVIVIGIMWGLVFSPYGLLSEIVNRAWAASFAHKVARLFQQAGGFNISDELVRGLVELSGPAAGQTFANPLVDLKDFLLSYAPGDLAVLQKDLVNLLGPKWFPSFLAKADVAMLPVLWVVLWCWTGMYLILFLANMQKIDVQIIEAARIDGASEGQVMTRVVLPALSGVIVNAAILCISGSLNSFALVFAMTRGGPARVTQLLSIYMYDNAFAGAPDYPLSNAIAMSIVLLSLLLIAVTKLAEKRFGGRE